MYKNGTCDQKVPIATLKGIPLPNIELKQFYVSDIISLSVLQVI